MDFFYFVLFFLAWIASSEVSGAIGQGALSIAEIGEGQGRAYNKFAGPQGSSHGSGGDSAKRNFGSKGHMG
ncbi:unnamed protein product [Allacma fusca]|uniref:Glycine-rich protein n=1 Tax=Allacma fusca TaxID=39272 RepID=A0A8J2LNP1_9HEXA|nr:unnamed protein product [Allacma fusca]